MTIEQSAVKGRNGTSYPWLRLNGKDYNLEAMTVDDLLELKLRVDKHVDALGQQLSQAYAAAKVYQQAKDPRWIASTHLAKKSAGRMGQVILNEIGRRKRQKNTELASAFMAVAREKLDLDTFHAILDIAKERVAE